MKLSSPCYLLPLAVLFGTWSVCQACNTNPDSCNDVRDSALSMETLESICIGLVEYLRCVDAATVNCTDSTERRTSASELVQNVCSAAVFCSEKLGKCSANLTTEVIGNITSSDNATKVQLCRSLVTPILACQEALTSECSNQEGFLQTVTSQRESMAYVCNDPFPCLGKITQCHSPINDLASSTPDTKTCSQELYIDYCSAYQLSLSCVKNNLTACSDQISLGNFVATLENATKLACDSILACQQKVSSCSCHIISMKDPTSTITNICSAFPLFKTCLMESESLCHNNTEMITQVTAMKASLQPYYDTYCIAEEGLCPLAIQCLANVSQHQGDTPTQSAQDSLGIINLCSTVNSVFQCLEKAQESCGQKAGNITLSQLGGNYQDSCTDIAPHLQALSTCPSFANCTMRYDLTNLINLNTTSPLADIVNVTKRLFAGLTNSSFWCNYLSFGYQCLEEGAKACSLGAAVVNATSQNYRDIVQLCQGGPTTGKYPSTTTEGGGSTSWKEPSGTTKGGGVNNTDDKENRAANMLKNWMVTTALALLLLVLTVYGP